MSISRVRTIMLCFLIPFGLPGFGQTPSSPFPMPSAGQSVERDLKGGETHAHTVRLAAGQYLYLNVNQNGIDVVVSMFDPKGAKIVEIDSPNEKHGPEPVYLIAETAGDYRLEVVSLDKKASPGKYAVKVEALATPSQADRERYAAYRLFADACMLGFGSSAAEDRRKAAEHFQTALLHWRTAGDVKHEALTLDYLASTHRNLGQTEKAVEGYLQALSLWEKTGDVAGKATALSNLAAVYANSGNRLKAVETYEEAVAAYVEAGDRLGQATTLNHIGFQFNELREFRKAIPYFEKALVVWPELRNPAEQGKTLNNLGFAYGKLGEYQKGLDYYFQALPLRVAGGDLLGQAQTLGNIGSLYVDAGDHRKALDYYNQVLEIHSKLGNRRNTAQTLNSMSVSLEALGQRQKAFNCLNQALKLFADSGDTSGEASALHNLGLYHYNSGEKRKAAETLEKLLPIWTRLNDRFNLANTLNALGIAYIDLGEEQTAVEHLNRALPLFVAVGSRTGQAAALNNLGLAYIAVGNYKKAFEYSDQAISIWSSDNNRQYLATALTNQAFLLAQTGEPRRAREQYEQALKISTEAGDMRVRAAVLVNLGLANNALVPPEKQFEYLSKSLELWTQLGDRRSIGRTLANLGKYHFAVNEDEKAAERFKEALPILIELGDQMGVTQTLHASARLERRRGNLTQALADIEKAVRTMEILRMKAGSPENRSSYFASIQEQFQFYIDLLMELHQLQPEKGFNRQAFQVAEQARARSLIDLLNDSKVDIRHDADPELIARRRDVFQRLNDKAARLTDLKNRKSSPELVAEIEREIDALTDEYRDVQNRIRTDNPRYAALTQPDPIDLDDVQGLLDSDTVLLEYRLGEERSRLWVVTNTDLATFELPKRSVIEAAARNVYEALKNPRDARRNLTKLEAPSNPTKSPNFDQAARDLSRMILEPVLDRLGGNRLLVVPDGALEYVPFGALPVPRKTKSARPRFLIERNEVVYLPSAATLALQRKETEHRAMPDQLLAVIADPVFGGPDDTRLKPTEAPDRGKAPDAAPPADARQAEVADRLVERGIGSAGDATNRADRPFFIPRLLGTRREAERILGLVDASKSFRALDFDAGRQTVLDADLSGFKYIHFATHGLIDAERPELSSIVLSLVDKNGKPRNGFLRAMEVYNLNLPAELVTLSACETGLGKEIKGEGMVGLTRGFFYAGAKRLVVSLWSVADTSTSELMTAFYGHMLKENMRPAAALRAAQLEMLKNPKRRDPFYWAPFVLQGEYR